MIKSQVKIQLLIAAVLSETLCTEISSCQRVARCAGTACAGKCQGAGAVFANICSQRVVRLALACCGDDVNHSSYSISAVQGRGRAFDDLDAFNTGDWYAGCIYPACPRVIEGPAV